MCFLQGIGRHSAICMYPHTYCVATHTEAGQAAAPDAANKMLHDSLCISW